MNTTNDELYMELPWTDEELANYVTTQEEYLEKQYSLNELLFKHNLTLAAFLEIRAYVIEEKEGKLPF